MKLYPLCGAIVALVSPLLGQSTRHNFSPPPQDVLWPAQIVDEDLLMTSEWAGEFSINNRTNNTVFIDDNYLATGNAAGISGNAFWGNPRSGFPLGSPFMQFTFSGYFGSSVEDGALDQVTEVSFDFAWASTDFEADLTQLAIQVMDYDFNTEVIYIDLENTFNHSLVSGGEGRSGRVTIRPVDVANVFAISFTNLHYASSEGNVGEFAIDNLEIIQNGQGVDDLYPVRSNGDREIGYSTNAVTGTGGFSVASQLKNQGTIPTTYSVTWTSSSPALYQYMQQDHLPIAAGATIPAALQWSVNTDTTPSGSYTGKFTVVNHGAPMDPDNEVNISDFRLYDPALPVANNGTTKAPGDNVSLTNAAPAAHPGALRASMKVTEVSVSHPRFSVSGLAVDTVLDAGESTGGRVSFNASGLVPGTYAAELRVKLQMTSPADNYLNSAPAMSDVVWPLSYTIGNSDSVVFNVASGQGLVNAGLQISGGGTAASFAGGSSGATQDVGIEFVPSPPTPNPSGTARAVSTSFSVSPGLHVLQISYPNLPAGYSEEDLRIHALSNGIWVPAISLNGNGSATVGSAPFMGSYATYLAGPGGGTLDVSDLGAFGIDMENNRAWVVLDYQGTFQITLGEAEPTVTPVITAVTYDRATNTTTIHYQSVAGIVFRVLGAPGLTGFTQVGTTAPGTGAVMQFTHQPPGAPNRYFYRLANP
ncbi:hypothetical protein OKA04_05810 [Luteolibacter flavescens]|uniref:CARDB domain-containing protein n=1 Tax=Luteolibacter flavescens TaxID=1859460 RepID=A0ABT3FKY5_9BACT|nr:hypothetical protein [Luteolibacter flavescens]MCW1884238.1 hypothetical protein [Luteolibacter flavescens]